MTRCRYCEFDLTGEPEQPARCPNCGKDVDTRDQWATIAQLHSVAECGYCADLLKAEGIETAIHEQNKFSAVHGAATPLYLLQVPSSQAVAAAQVVVAELEGSEPDEISRETPDDTNSFNDEATWDLQQATGTYPWRLVVWAALIALILVLGARLAWPPKKKTHARPHAGHDLWNSLTEQREEFIAADAQGRSLRRLSIDPRQQTIVLYDDLDGNGTFERVRSFRNGVLVEDSFR